MNLVVDASVALKWFFRERTDEQDLEPALAILEDLGADRWRLLQPPHFLIEVAAVLAREKPATAADDLRDLAMIQWRTVDDPLILAGAMKLSINLRHHLFDTLYHAVALSEPSTLLVTADRTYFEKAQRYGGIRLLSAFF